MRLLAALILLTTTPVVAQSMYQRDGRPGFGLFVLAVPTSAGPGLGIGTAATLAPGLAVALQRIRVQSERDPGAELESYGASASFFPVRRDLVRVGLTFSVVRFPDVDEVDRTVGLVGGRYVRVLPGVTVVPQAALFAALPFEFNGSAGSSLSGALRVAALADAGPVRFVLEPAVARGIGSAGGRPLPSVSAGVVARF